MPGASRYTVEYSLHYVEEKNLKMEDFVKSLIVNNEQNLGVVTKFTNIGTKAQEDQILRIEHRVEKPGPYLLTLVVTDEYAHLIAEKSILLRLVQ